jgi:O-methyltransferase involved in polyketide biosynthesis
MAITLPTLTPVEDSLLLTLYCKALDSRLPKPLLSDAMADEIVRKLDYDFEQFKVNDNFLRNVALRSKKMDEVASAFIRHHPDAVGLDLGVGLDTRLVRLAPPSTGTTWISLRSATFESAWYPIVRMSTSLVRT